LPGVIAVILAITASALHARELRVSGGACANVVQVVAHDVSLSDVLRGLSQRLAFEMSFEASNDPPVNIDAAGGLPDVLRQVAESMNFSMAMAPDPRCAGRLRVMKMSILSTRLTVPPQAIAAPPQYARITDERDEAAAAHLIAHGYTPPPNSQSYSH
jgi:hypothetical protein